MKFLKPLSRFICSAGGVFLLGAIIGAIFFTTQFGFSVVNPLNADWIWHDVTHDTAQHHIGWEFFRADSTGGMINSLAYPEGLPLTFMDAIPLIALPLKLIAGVLPSGFQYFGLWALLCYILVGGLGAMLVRKIWLKVFKTTSTWTTLFSSAGALILVLSPMILARTLYHPSLAAHWLILLGFLLILYREKFIKAWQFTMLWSVLLVVSVLIHPYFLPMMIAIMTVVALLNMKPRRISRELPKFFVKIIIPIVASGLVFAAIGGFALGSGAEIRDLHEKGFNLLSFANPGGYSVIPRFSNASSSPETMMWLGLGVWVMIITATILWFGRYKKSFKEFRRRFAVRKARNVAILAVSVGLMVFAIGVRLDVGPVVVFQWEPPNKIYEIWSAFRAAAREAWPFYYATILAVVCWFALAIKKVSTKRFSKKKVFTAVAISLLVISLAQFTDIFLSKNASQRRDGFTIARTTEPQFRPIDIDDLVTTQKHLVMLDRGFRGDQGGTYKISRTALANNLTLNIGFFARIPDPIWQQQATWREKVQNGELTADDLNSYLFATKDEKLIEQVNDKYEIEKRGDFYFIGSF